MKAMLTHIGAWSPMAEQKATAAFLGKKEAINAYLAHFKKEVEERLHAIYNGFMQLKAEGFPVDAIAPQAAIYLTIKIDLSGKKTDQGSAMPDQAAVTSYILNAAKLAIVPFSAFGAGKNDPWYRLSVGTCKKEQIPAMLQSLRNLMLTLK